VQHKTIGLQVEFAHQKRGCEEKKSYPNLKGGKWLKKDGPGGIENPKCKTC